MKAESGSLSPLRVGLVGLNFGGGLADSQIIGKDAGRFIRIVAVCDRDAAKARSYGESHDLPYYTDLGEMLCRSNLEAVILITPPSGRAGLIHQCLQAGRHVLTTKPFELDPAAAEAVLREASELGLIVHVNSPGPLPSSDLQQIQEWHRKYHLGRPVSGHWETYAKYHEKADGSWLDSFEKCPVAPIFRLGIYGIGEMTAVMGEIESVEVLSSRIFTGRPTPDNAQLMILFKNGAIGSIYASLGIQDGTLYPAEFTVHYEFGTIRKIQIRNAEDRGFVRQELHLKTQIDDRFHEEYAVLPVANRSGAYQYENFYRAVRYGRHPDEISPEVIVAGVRAIAMMIDREKHSLDRKSEKEG